MGWTNRHRSVARPLSACVAVIACFAAALVHAVGSADAGRRLEAAPASRGATWVVANEPPGVVLVSDSAIAGIRWTNNLHLLTGPRWDARLESCRRLVYPSCRGREGYSPPTMLEELRSITAAGGVDQQVVLLVAVGYNDWEERFSTDVDAVLAEARRAGFGRVGWLTYRTGVGYQLPGNAHPGAADYAAMNQMLRQKAASGRWPELVVIDFAQFTAPHHTWFTPDGVHLTGTGGWVIAHWLSDIVRFSTTPALAPANWRPGG